MQDKKARFRCGQLCTTPAALDKVGRAGLIRLLERHLSGDWVIPVKAMQGPMRRHFAAGTGLFHGIRISKELRIMIITEADRSATTILLPEEY